MHPLDNELRKLFPDARRGIFYIGASVTAQKEGFRPKLHSLICEETQQALPMYVDALGGVGSLFGLANWEFVDEALKKNSQMILFEYSTGDLNIGITPLNILSQVLDEYFSRLSQYQVPVFVVHNFRSDFPGQKGKLIRDVYDAAAIRYGFYVINVFELVERAIASDREWLNTHYRDHVHMTEKGADVIANWILAGIKAALGTQHATNFSPPPRRSEAPFSTLQLIGARGILNSEPDGELTYAASGQGFSYIEIRADRPLEFMLKGRVYGLMLIIGPESCYLNIEVDDVPVCKVLSFDRNCHYDRPHCFPIRIDLTNKSRVKLSHASDPIDFTILTRPTSRTKNPRLLKFVGIVGTEVEAGA